MDCRSACIQGVLKVKVKGHVILELSWILGMSYSIIDGLVDYDPMMDGGGVVATIRFVFPTILHRLSCLVLNILKHM